MITRFYIIFTAMFLLISHWLFDVFHPFQTLYWRLDFVQQVNIIAGILALLIITASTSRLYEEANKKNQSWKNIATKLSLGVPIGILAGVVDYYHYSVGTVAMMLILAWLTGREKRELGLLPGIGFVISWNISNIIMLYFMNPAQLPILETSIQTTFFLIFITTWRAALMLGFFCLLRILAFKPPTYEEQKARYDAT